MWRNDKVFDGTDVYVGSTSKPLSVRLSEHRSRAKGSGYENNKLYERMRAVGADKWKVTLLLSRMCDKNTIRLLEREKCSELNTDLNTLSPITTPEEKRLHKTDYREKNKDALLKYAADYRKANRQNRRYYCAICEVACGYNKDLQKHLKTSKHFWKYIYSVD